MQAKLYSEGTEGKTLGMIGGKWTLYMGPIPIGKADEPPKIFESDGVRLSLRGINKVRRIAFYQPAPSPETARGAQAMASDLRRPGRSG